MFQDYQLSVVNLCDFTMLLSSYCKLFSLSVWFLTQASEDLLREHYIDLKDRPFYDGLVQYMHSGPVVAMVSSWQGKTAWLSSLQ